MALERLGESDEEYEGLDKYISDAEGQDDASFESISAPLHPISGMQEAFEESIREAQDEEENPEPVSTELDAEARRRELLDQDSFDDSWTTRWKQRPSARCHPLVKLMAQIIFGLHLLHQQQAKSDAEVVKILQNHVDEIDGFLEKTTEDFDLAIKDIEERIGFLKLPMTHVEVFDIMLEDRKFRTQLVEGNMKIEKIIERTAKAMNAALLDIQKGVNTTQQLAIYLERATMDWPQQSPEQAAILVAMRGNEEGWRLCFGELQSKGHKLGVALVKLGTVVGEMNKLAAAASRRRTMKTAAAKQAQANGAIPRSRYAEGSSSSRTQDRSRDRPHTPRQETPESRPAQRPQQRTPVRKRSFSDKPLPKDPDLVGAAVKATIPRAYPMHIESRKSEYEDSGFYAKSPARTSTETDRSRVKPVLPLDTRSQTIRPPATSSTPSISTKSRPSSNMVPREACSPTISMTKDLAGFIRDGPPIQQRHGHSPRTSVGKPYHSAVYERHAMISQPRQASGRTRHARSNSDTVPRTVHPVTISTGSADSAYASGTDQQAKRRPKDAAQLTNHSSPPAPSRSTSKLALFPSPGPASPNPEVRPTTRSLVTPPRTPDYTTTPRSGFSLERPKSPTPSFSIRKMFNRKSKGKPVAV